MSLKCFGNIWSGVMPTKNEMIGMQMRNGKVDCGHSLMMHTTVMNTHIATTAVIKHNKGENMK